MLVVRDNELKCSKCFDRKASLHLHMLQSLVDETEAKLQMLGNHGKTMIFLPTSEPKSLGKKGKWL